MNLSRPFIERPVATVLLMVALLLTGLVAYRELPVSALPQVDYPTIQVMTFYPGADPEVMASSVTAPLERQFGQVPGLTQMTSSSSEGCSVITLRFALELDIDVAEQQVQAAINAAAGILPRDLPNPPTYSKTNPADAPVLTLALSSEALPLPKVEDLADTRLAQRISQLSGVGLVSIGGGQKPSIRVQVNPTSLAAVRMTTAELRQALAQANVNQAKGSFDGDRQAATIGANDQLLTSEQYRQTIIAYRNGAPVRLSDVANVVDGVENSRQAAWMNDTPAVILNIQRQPGANVIEVVDRVKALLPQLRASLPASVEITILTDRTKTIRASVAETRLELLYTVGLVVLVMFLFLKNPAATLIPSVSAPLSLIGAFGVMYMLDYSLNNLTLMALTISTGFVVDDAIVMIENVARHVERGETPLAAALKGSRQIGFTIVSLSVSLIAVLIPLLFMGDVVGRLFREFAVTLSATIVISAIVSLTLTPMMCATLLRSRNAGILRSGEPGLLRSAEPGGESHDDAQHTSGRLMTGILRAYDVTLRWVLRHPAPTLVVAGATLAATIYLYVIVPKGFFPSQDTGLILGISEAAQDISFDAMVERQRELNRAILADPAVESLASFIGVEGTNVTANSGRALINLKPLEERDASAEEVILRLRERLASIEGIRLYLQPSQDLTVETRVSRTQFQFTLEDPSEQELSEWVPIFLDRLRSAPELRDVTSDLLNEGRQARLVIDRDTASRLGITPQMIDDALYDAFGQRQISIMFTQLNQYRVVLEAQPAFRRDPSDLTELYLRGPRGGTTPLSALAHVTRSNAPLAINHQGQFPVVTVSFDLAPGVSLGEATRAIAAAQRDVELPPSIQAEFQGTAEAFQAALANEPLLILAALVTVYITLGVLYESYIHPITILSTLPSAGVGAILALLICREELSVIALIGIILLIGIVKKNAIMMIDFALDAERQEGKSPREAIHEACLLRFRPILMTTLAALFGAVPLAVGGGVGAELRRPLGITIIGGLLLSQALTLYTTPVIYLAFDRVGRSLRNWIGRAPLAASRDKDAPEEGPSKLRPPDDGGTP